MAKRRRKSPERKSRITSADDTVMESLQAMSELDLTNDILRPLLIACGYKTVEYNGGNDERGQDLICVGEDRFGNETVLAIQVKKYSPTGVAHDTKSFGGLVTQLSQALETPVPTLDGDERFPTEVCLITPFPVETRVLKTRFERYAELRRRNLQVIDGVKLVELLKTKRRKVYDELGGRPYDIMSQLENQLNNSALMSVLRRPTLESIRSFYTDLDLALGRRATRLLLASTFRPTAVECPVTSEEWKDLKELEQACKTKFGVRLIGGAIARIDRKLQTLIKDRENALAVSAKVVEDIRRGEADIQTEQKALNRAFTDTGVSIREFQDSHNRLAKQIPKAKKQVIALEKELAETDSGTSAHKQTNRELGLANENRDRLQDQYRQLLAENQRGDFFSMLEAIDALKSEFESHVASDKLSTRVANFRQRWKQVIESVEKTNKFKRHHVWDRADRIVGCYEQLSTLDAKLKRLPSFSVEPTVSVSVCGEEIAAVLRQNRASIRRAVTKVNRGASPEELRQLLMDCDSLFSFCSALFRNKHAKRALRPSRPKKKQTKTTGSRKSSRPGSLRLTVSLHDLIDTGMNLLVLGEAGAGKTTSLQSYNLQVIERTQTNVTDSKTCVFVPLGRMANQDAPGRDGNNTDLRLPRICISIHRYLQSLDVSITEDEWAALLRSDGTTLILDGVDEAVRLAPWVLTEIASLGHHFPNLQIVTSSRIAGDYVEQIPFLAVRLLPFTIRQRSRFIKRWFEARSKVLPRSPQFYSDRLRDHLAVAQDLAQVVRSPLLATVLCVLSEHEVALPNTEVTLYAERMKLATGLLDMRKDVPVRLESSPEDLLLVARAAAYQLHKSGQRQADIEMLVASTVDHVRGRISLQRCQRALWELVDPCNILVASDDGTYGFGHLRFQEYLAAEEIRNNRAIDVRDLLSSRWWRDACVLFAKLDGRFEWLIDQTQARLLFHSMEIDGNLHAMIRARPPAERRSLCEAVMRRCKRDGTVLIPEFTGLVDDDDEDEYWE